MIGLLAQAGKESDFWSKLLGIDRVARDGEVSLTWHNLPATWLLVLVVVPAVIALVYLIYRRERRDIGAGPKIFLTALRAMLVLLVLFMMFGPVLTVETIKVRKSYVIVLVDESLSMRKSDPPLNPDDIRKIATITGISPDDEISEAERQEVLQLTRADIIRRVLENPGLHILEDLESKLNVEYHTFSNRTSSKGVNDLGRKKMFEEYSAIGPETAIGDAMKQSLNLLKGQLVVAVIVLSDGRNNSGVDPKDVAQQFAKRYLPVYTVIAGIPQVPKDIALMEPEGRDAVLANDEFALNFKIRSFGFEGEACDVQVYINPLKEKDKEAPTDPEKLKEIVQDKKAEIVHRTTLQGANKKQLETIIHQFKNPGEYQLILKIDERAGENTGANNWLTHRVSVRDDKIKVLYVEHPPRYEYRFLKNALIRDTKIMCHCLLTSADEGFPQEHTKGAEDKAFAEPIKEFPQTLEELLKYDVIILGDVEPGKLGGEKVLENLETFVSEFGGGLVMISGMASNPRQYREKAALERLLPISLDETRDPFEHEKIYDQTYGYALTEDGKKHPITGYRQFGKDRVRNTEHWEDADKRGDGQVGLRWFVRAKKVKQGASTLIEAVGGQSETQRFPLFVTQFYGAGRVFWSATDETWLWRYLVGDYPWYYPFWQQAMYWAREGKLLGAKRYRIDVDKERYMVGDPVHVYASAFDRKFQRLTDPKLTIFVEPPFGERQKIELDKDRKQDGVYEGSFVPRDVGAYKVWAGEEDESTRAYDKFVVYIPNREEDEPILDPAALETIAKNSFVVKKDKSQFYTIDRVGELARDVKAGDHILHDTKEDDLWDSPAIYLLFALIITIEWVMRKVWRML